MNELEMKILCDGCLRQKQEIQGSGSKYGVDFVTFKSEKRYIIRDNTDISWDEIMKNRDKFILTYVPKFGKYEIEEFVGYKMMEALFITKDITELLNSELLCDDLPYNVTRIKQDILKKRIMKCFDVIWTEEFNNNIVTLVFKWKPWCELE